MGKLEGRVAFITGAAKGQGRSHALRLAAEGADIIGVDISTQVATCPYPTATAEDLAETARQVEALGRRFVGAEADVRDLDALGAAVDKGVAELGRLDIVCANAGIASFAPGADMSEEMWEEMVGINLSGVWRTCRVAIPHLIASGGGSIVMTSSLAGLKGLAGIAHYASAKHGMLGLMKVLAVEYGGQGIRVNAVHPTNVDTDMIMNDATMGQFGAGGGDPKAAFAEAARQMHVLEVPWVESIDISNAVAFLVSDEARYITGVSLPVDAGAAIK
ncbi:mycofactocin-coupled SDR family oxidoreductase [uncultured Dietzia sp.]|uniref:mycofactocin-coupled SDR family oxidoreductase n=2 Tax=Dietzia TaxID=37914 RepID=UPI00260B07ED|nr:mycofactocin-coupled SDR family oxidoreductase [uncultured Dietzia sp.]HMT49894.1 mycofactocin-coupled SDR family oxidoreductase [Dietzia sp.]